MAETSECVRLCLNQGAFRLTSSADTAFKQQRLKAWQPILTPKTVLPTLFIIGLIFAPIGGLLIWGSSLVTEMTFDYTDCDSLDASQGNGTYTFTDIPSDKYNYRLRSGDSGVTITRPKYAFLDNSGNNTVTDIFAKKQCVVQFHVPVDLESSVFMYYKLTNFYQNHRRYVKSLHSDQLKGKYVSPADLRDSDCKPLGSPNGDDEKAIYPCGLIANSLFNGLCTQFSDMSSMLTPLRRHVFQRSVLQLARFQCKCGLSVFVQQHSLAWRERQICRQPCSGRRLQ